MISDKAIEDIIKKLEREEVKPRHVENFVNGDRNLGARIRRKYYERKYGVDLSSLAPEYVLDLNKTSKNIEIPIGVFPYPVAPIELNVEGEYTPKDKYLIIGAVTEGALIAGMNRAAEAINECEGVYSTIIETYVPTSVGFKVTKRPKSKYLKEALNWVKEHEKNLIEISRKESGHAKVVDIKSYAYGGDNLAIILGIDPTRAAGMNTVRKMGKAIVPYVEESGYLKFWGEAANVDGDKKRRPKILGKGHHVFSEAYLTRDVMRRKLKTSQRKFIEIYERKIVEASKNFGVAPNAHIANAAAAFLIPRADPAHVVEASLGSTTVRKEKDETFIGIDTWLNLGNIGGVARLPSTQAVYRAEKSFPDYEDKEGKTAKSSVEKGGAYILASETGLIATIAAGKLVEAHMKFGR
jgi:hydroxymethylglutaryl-CoA reductase